jgi:hypothetical protein
VKNILKWIIANTFTLLCLAMPRRKHPDNSLAEFTVQLAQRIELGLTECWEVGLWKFSCPPPKPIDVVGTPNALVYCDLIMPQFVGSQYGICFRLFIHESKYCDHTFKHVYYVSRKTRLPGHKYSDTGSSR